MIKRTRATPHPRVWRPTEELPLVQAAMMAGCLLCRVHRLKVVVAAMTEDHLEATLVLHLRGVEEDTSNLAEVQEVVVEVAMEMVEAAMEGGVAVVLVAMEGGMGDMAVVVVEEAVMEAVREVEDLVEEAVVAGVDMEVTAEVEVGASLVEEEEEEALVVAEEVLEVVAAVEDLVGMTGLKRCRATTRSLSRECQLMSQKMMLPSSSVPSAQSRRTEKLANSAFSSTQIAILAPPREKAPSLMKIQAPHSLLFNGSMARNSAPAAPSKLAWP